MSQQIGLHEPLFDEEDEKLVLEALRSSWVSTGGPFVNQFEKEFAEFVGVKHAISVCNGTLGLQLSVECLKRKLKIFDNFEILLPSLTFIATANAIVHAGGFPAFVDVEKNSFQMSPTCLKETLTTQYEYLNDEKVWINKLTRRKLIAIMPVHIMGYLAPITELLNISLEFGIPIIEDAAEALGTYHLNQKHAGTDGLVAVFSFNGNKILTTGGGGMIVTNDDIFAAHLKHLSTTAKIDNLRFIHDEIGYNFRLVNILAAFGCSQLKKLQGRLKRKKEIFDLYSYDLCKENSYVYSQKDCISNHWLVNVIFKNSDLRDLALNSLIENGIQARPLWTPCHLQPAYSNYINEIILFNSENIWKRTLSLPSSPQLSNEQIRGISTIILLATNGV